MIVAMSATARAVVSRVAKAGLDRGQEIAFWLLIPTALILGFVAIRLNAPPPQLTTERSEWPMPSDEDIRELGKKLSQYHPTGAEIAYGDGRDKPLAVSFARAMFLANWPEAGVGMSGTIIGITIQGPPEMQLAMNALRDFCVSKLGTTPKISDTLSATSWIHVTIGNKPPSE